HMLRCARGADTDAHVAGRHVSLARRRHGGPGNVVVVRIDGAKLRTEVLRYNQAQNKVSSDKAFVFDEPARHIKGEGFTSDPDFKVVTAIRPTGTGGTFTLPNPSRPRCTF